MKPTSCGRRSTVTGGRFNTRTCRSRWRSGRCRRPTPRGRGRRRRRRRACRSIGRCCRRCARAAWGWRRSPKARGCRRRATPRSTRRCRCRSASKCPRRPCAPIVDARGRGGRVIAVGTSVVRALESAAASGELRPTAGETDLDHRARLSAARRRRAVHRPARADGEPLRAPASVRLARAARRGLRARRARRLSRPRIRRYESDRVTSG